MSTKAVACEKLAQEEFRKTVLSFLTFEDERVICRCGTYYYYAYRDQDDTVNKKAWKANMAKHLCAQKSHEPDKV